MNSLYRNYLALALCCLLMAVSIPGARAQSSNCIFKDPVFSLDFGTAASSNATLLYDNEIYRAGAGPCPAAGTYGYAASTGNCNNAWHTITEDHTAGDKDGQMMIIHTGDKRGDFLIMQVSGLKAGNTYRVSAWFMNICKPASCSNASAMIEVSIWASNQQLGSFKTAGLETAAVPAWKNQQGEFVMIPGTDVITLRMKNLNAGDCGNDVALDDIEINQCSLPATKPTAAPAPATEVKAFATPVPGVMETRANPVVKQIHTEAGELNIELYDNGEVDGDTVSIYHNQELVIAHAGISTKPVSFKIKVDEQHPHHELVMVADNLGRIPPNTSLMIITAGKKRYEVFIASSEQKNAKVVIDLQ